MSFGKLTTRVRPIRVAFLVDPTNTSDVYRAITLSTALWGGKYNAIVPVYRRMPSNWQPPESGAQRCLPTSSRATSMDSTLTSLCLLAGAQGRADQLAGT